MFARLRLRPQNAHSILTRLSSQMPVVGTLLAASSRETWWKRTRQAASLRVGEKVCLVNRAVRGRLQGSILRISSEEIHKSLEEIPISLPDLCISGKEIANSLKELAKSDRKLPNSSRELTNSSEELANFFIPTTQHLASHAQSQGRPPQSSFISFSNWRRRRRLASHSKGLRSRRVKRSSLGLGVLAGTRLRRGTRGGLIAPVVSGPLAME